MTSWTPEEDEVLRQGLRDSLTYAQIGAQIGRTRKAVGGRVHTLNLPKRYHVAPQPVDPLGDFEPLEPAPVLVERREGCQWIHGDPKEPGWRKCGEPISHKAYCQKHAKLAYITKPFEGKQWPAPRRELRTDFA